MKPKLYIKQLFIFLLAVCCNHSVSANDTIMNTAPSRTILFITGAFVSHHCWDNWKAYYESRGYKTLAPSWPEKDAEPEVLRSQHPYSNIARITLQDLVEHYTAIIQSLSEKPILIGHSLGGLVVQLLLNKGYGASGVAIHSVPPQGVLPLEWSFYKSNLAALGIFTSARKTYLMPFRKWQYVFTNDMCFEEQKKGYEQLAIPESKKALRGGLTKAAKIDFRKEHPPLLIVAGTKDHCMPAALNKRNFNRYKKGASVTEYVVREGRNHFVLGQDTWKEDASYILNWIQHY